MPSNVYFQIPKRTMTDELAKAIARIVYPALKEEGFQRVRKRDLIWVGNGMVQLLYFQVSGWGSREFSVTACANLVASNDHTVLIPGFRLRRNPDTGELWLPYQTADEASSSAKTMVEVIYAQAIPYFRQIRTLDAFRDLLSSEQWGAQHHLNFQRGVAAALAGYI